MEQSLSSSMKSAAESRRRQKYRTIGYFAAFVSLGLSQAAIGPTLSGLAEHTHSQLSDVSFLFTARSLGYLLASLRGGRLFDRLPGHPLMVLFLLVMATLLLLVPLVPLLWLLAALLVILGIAESLVDIGANTLLLWSYGEKAGPFMNGLHFFFGIGAFLSPVIIAQMVLMSGDIYWAYWALGLLVVPAAIWLARLPSPAVKTVSEDRPASQINHKLVVLFSLAFFLYVGAEVSYGGWIYSYALKLDLASERGAAYLTSAFWGALTLGRLVSVPMAARFRPSQVLVGDLAGCLASLSLILVFPGSQVATWAGTLSTGFFMAAIFPTTLSLAERRMSITGQVTGWFFVGAGAGGMFLPWLIGQLFTPAGAQVTMISILADIMVAVVVYLMLIQSSPGAFGVRGT